MIYVIFNFGTFSQYSFVIYCILYYNLAIFMEKGKPIELPYLAWIHMPITEPHGSGSVGSCMTPCGIRDLSFSQAAGRVFRARPDLLI